MILILYIGHITEKDETQELDFWGCIRYGREAVNSLVYVVKTDGDKQNIGSIFYTMGNAYYYLDYSISLAKSGNLEQAGAVLENMLEQYPDRYKTYMRLAFLEAHIQQNKANQDRDYHKMKGWGGGFIST